MKAVAEGDTRLKIVSDEKAEAGLRAAAEEKAVWNAVAKEEVRLKAEETARYRKADGEEAARLKATELKEARRLRMKALMDKEEQWKAALAREGQIKAAAEKESRRQAEMKLAELQEQNRLSQERKKVSATGVARLMAAAKETNGC